MADPAVLKQIKIQTGVVKRLVKVPLNNYFYSPTKLGNLLQEHASYIKEVEKETQKIEKMKAEAQNEDDEYAIKKAGQVLQVTSLRMTYCWNLLILFCQETRGMIGDTARRCVTATAALQKLLDESGLEECQELTDAKAQIEAASAITTA
ncbi:hypothetical protein ANCCEY_07661 [Ancylostoma ceylanicum]|nr:hypothetical protein ANCCEY_07661 [Ancylostoma ceylanicum]